VRDGRGDAMAWSDDLEGHGIFAGSPARLEAARSRIDRGDAVMLTPSGPRYVASSDDPMAALALMIELCGSAVYMAELSSRATGELLNAALYGDDGPEVIY